MHFMWTICEHAPQTECYLYKGVDDIQINLFELATLVTFAIEVLFNIYFGWYSFHFILFTENIEDIDKI